MTRDELIQRGCAALFAEAKAIEAEDGTVTPEQSFEDLAPCEQEVGRRLAVAVLLAGCDAVLEYLDRSIATYDRDAPSNDFQRGALETLKVVRAELGSLLAAVDAPEQGAAS